MKDENVSEFATLVAVNNEFAFKFYKALKSDEKNIFFSPFSISLCLAMACVGARGATADQMASVMHFKEEPDLNASFNGIMRTLNDPSRSHNFELCVANALWLQEDYSVYPEYLEIIQNSYLGGLSRVDFKTNPEATRNLINSWVEEKTKNKIKELIKPGIISSLTRLILTNAIYFFSNWQHQFLPDLTSEAPFTLINGQQVKVPLMFQKRHYIYTENSEFQAIELPYLGGELSMVLFLPRKVDGIADMENKMTVKDLTGWISPPRSQEVKVYIPKFKITSEFYLAENLKSMGMVDAFELMKADFTGITPKNPDPLLNLFLSEVIHKAFIDVNEQGTEAAAATATALLAGSPPGAPPPVPTFRADHPFLLLIRDIRTNSILFLGRIMDPRSEYCADSQSHQFFAPPNL